ncbi:hypothetical protein VP1G_04288 [Cytospora mali]|uniref:Uncharacterized protein n=1 Tax=Cytospora mali TaxID=578113 RepID=A0A194UZ91_CYTMA|nr:hypothetical protein VP1G_04288 [Valsa mali var. pyri (nom. inval.)]
MRAALGGAYWSGQNQRKMTKKSISAGPPESSSQDNACVSQQQQQYTPSALEAENFADFLEPAVEGPPSPGRIRALSNKVKQASVSERHVSQQTASSGSSSLLSLASVDHRPSWDQTMDSLSLSRKSSTRSTTSSMRERPESVQAIGKAIFHRKSKFRRDSLANAGNDMDGAGERARTSSISKERGLSMSLFSRRKTVQAGEASSAQKKPQISSPFNFQHVTQVQRDQLPSIGRGSQAMLQNEFSTMRAGPMPTTGLSNSIQAEDLRVPNFSSRATRPHDDDDIAPHVVPHSREGSMSRPPSWQKSPTRPNIRQTQSQDQLSRMAPPRPPRSPTPLDLEFEFGQPMPPHLNSRRPSIPRRDSEALVNQSISGFAFPAPPPLQSAANSPPASPTTKTERRYSRIFMPSPAENPNWPLPLSNASTTTFEAALPDVPEEEEHHGQNRSRASTRSTNSSLRGSQSVPALRKMSAANPDSISHDRSLSRESTVFGYFDMSAIQRAVMESVMSRNDDAEPLPRDAWEDVIDYCYEHEAEADCDYDWDRPSLNQDMEPTFVVTDDGTNDATLCQSSFDRFRIPSLSPSSNLSVGSAQEAQEAITPMIPTALSKSPTQSNFSLPRRDTAQPQRLLHVRTTSQASSFKESHGFTLSPSMLIPTDYHQELLAHQAELDQQEPDSPGLAVTYEDPRLNNMESSNLFVAARSSASTTASIGTSRSNFDRHISTISANTDYTRLTMSTSSLNIEDYLPKDEAPQAISTEEKEIIAPETISGVSHIASTMSPHARSQSIAGLLNSSGPRPLSRDNHSSDPNLGGVRFAKSPLGRGRSRTLSTPPPPGQYGLFPRPAN